MKKMKLAKSEITEMLGLLKTTYPYYAKGMDMEATVNIWHTLLKQFDGDVVKANFLKCLQECKLPPAPADIIQKIRLQEEASLATPEDLWGIFYTALRATMNEVADFGYTYIDDSGISQGEQARRNVTRIWENLPDEIKTYLSSCEELIRLAKTIKDEDLVYEKGRFIKTLPVINTRLEYNGVARLQGKQTNHYKAIDRGESL